MMTFELNEGYETSNFVIGAFKDSDETLGLDQQIHRVRIWDADIIEDENDVIRMRTNCPARAPYLHYDSTVLNHRENDNAIAGFGGVNNRGAGHGGTELVAKVSLKKLKELGPRPLGSRNKR